MNQLISLIVPAYNIESCLADTLDSILAQTHYDLEIIVVNDGSIDSTADIIDVYATKDSRIRAIHKENGGVTSARLRGVSEATGEWIGFVDGDDLIEPQMYERLLENALRYQADISHCGYQMVFPNGRIDYYYNTGRILHQSCSESVISLLSGDFEPSLVNKLYHQKLFSDLLAQERMPEDIRSNEDLLMNFWLFQEAGTSVYEDVCPYHYMLRKGSATTSKRNAHQLWDPLRVAQLLFDVAPYYAKSAAYQKLIRNLIGGASMTLSDQPELISPYRSYCRKQLRREIISFLRCGDSLKLKIMALWTAIWPWSYGFVHRMYMKHTGLDKKYDLD